MKTAIFAGLRRMVWGAALGAALAVAGAVSPVFAQDQGQLFATEEAGYGRLIVSFADRNVFPRYNLRVENGVLSLTFDDPVTIVMPDVGTAMPNYLSAARLDPDGRGLRMAMRSNFGFNRTDAGEKLFIDLLPPSWQGAPPTLPQEVLDELADRARTAAVDEERERKARMMAELDPRVNVRIGRNPTFLRLQFDWTVPTTAEFVQEGEVAHITFEWPVDVDLRDFVADLPPEVASVQSTVTPDGAQVAMTMAAGIRPRFYENSPQQFVFDIDVAGAGLPSFTAESIAEDVNQQLQHGATAEAPAAEPIVENLRPTTPAATLTPFVSVIGSTVRVVFPFDQDTPAAVFRRGDTVWMMFDTITGIQSPGHSPELDLVASDFSVQADGDTQLVRVQLTQDRLATLGSEGRAWVLSLGDIMLSPTEPISLSRRRDLEGEFEVTADVVRPARVHDFHDPLVGDDLTVVTAYPPARGVTRTLDYVEFSALRSVHGLVIKPKASDLQVAIENDLAVMSTNDGLTVSSFDTPRPLSGGFTESLRASFIDLGQLQQNDPAALVRTTDELIAGAATAEGKARDTARLNLAQHYLANQLSYEALGVISVLEADNGSDNLTRKIRMTKAIASTLSARPKDALGILNTPAMGQEIDALFWRAIARADAYDFKGARLDSIEANSIASTYPEWARNKFYFAAARSSLMTDDLTLAERFVDSIRFAGLSAEDASLYQFLSGWIDEGRGRNAEAIDTYGQVIAADFRPTRAEAVFRTLQLLDKQGSLNLDRATDTLAAEALLWRGNPLEAEMQAMLADLYFREGHFREGFEAAREAVSTYPESPPIAHLRDEAQRKFGELFLDGGADALPPVEALAIYYDFRQLTPAGARGDEMIRNLAKRLVRVDLLPQAAELLQYQLDNRLRGVAKTQVATDLAIIYIADRRPQDAMRVLNETRLPDLPDSLQRQRRLLEARAMLDAGRDGLALDMVRDMGGRDVEMLRIDANWKARRFGPASEMLEAYYSAEPTGVPLAPSARMGLVKAAVGFVLANDPLGLSRLRTKFSDAMVTTPEWAMFDLVTSRIAPDSLEFKAVASQISGIEGINAFLASYQEVYGQSGAVSPMVASQPSGGIASR